MKTLNEVWETCLHESGHIVVARAVNGWNTTAQASVDIKTRASTAAGTAVLPHGLSPTGEAIATAAGSHAAKLSRMFPRPRRKKIMMPPEGTAEGIRARAVTEAQSLAAKHLYREALDSGTDAEDIARYCISFDPANPADWTTRFRCVHAQAKLLTRQNRAAIREAAIRLFHEGAITIPGDPEHDEYFTPAQRRH